LISHTSHAAQLKPYLQTLPLISEVFAADLRVSPLKVKIPSKNMRGKPTNETIIHSVYYVTVAPTCFGITLPSSGSVPSAF
jgi:hypothetical protein